MDEKAENIKDVLWNNPLVDSIMKMGGCKDDCIIALHNQNQELIKQVMELTQLCPRKMKVGNKILIWRCPEDLIPQTEMESECVLKTEKEKQ